MSKKKLVLVSEFLGHDHNSTSYYWTKILESLIDSYEVIVVAPSSKENLHYLSGVDVKYFTYMHYSYDKSNMLSRLIAYIKMCLSMNKILAEVLDKVDVVISGTNPVFNLYFIAKLKKKFNFSWLLFGYDIFPENLVPANVISKKNPFYLIAHFFFQDYIRPQVD